MTGVPFDEKGYISASLALLTFDVIHRFLTRPINKSYKNISSVAAEDSFLGRSYGFKVSRLPHNEIILLIVSFLCVCVCVERNKKEKKERRQIGD